MGTSMAMGFVKATAEKLFGKPVTVTVENDNYIATTKDGTRYVAKFTKPFPAEPELTPA